MKEFSQSMQAELSKPYAVAARLALNARDTIAHEVIEGGGFCDDKTFSTVFFGGVDAARYKSDESITGKVLVDVPAQFSAAVTTAERIPFLMHEPFVAREAGGDRRNDIGVVLPASHSANYTGVGYRIEALRRSHGVLSYAGQVIFSAYSPSVALFDAARQIGEQAIFKVDRTAGNKEHDGLYLNDGLAFGVEAVRRHVLTSRVRKTPTLESMAQLDTYIADLRKAAKKAAS